MTSNKKGHEKFFGWLALAGLVVAGGAMVYYTRYSNNNAPSAIVSEQSETVTSSSNLSPTSIDGLSEQPAANDASVSTDNKPSKTTESPPAAVVENNSSVTNSNPGTNYSNVTGGQFDER